MSNVIHEYIGGSGIVTCPQYATHHRYQEPRPGDLLRIPDNLRRYPFAGDLARICSIDNEEQRASVCCDVGSAFLNEDGSVSVSGGPFQGVPLEDIHPGWRLHPTPFWNWGNNSAGAHQGVNWLLYRPIFILAKHPTNGDKAESYPTPRCGNLKEVRHLQVYHLNKEAQANTCGPYQFTVTQRASSFTAFRTRDEFERWLEERALALADPSVLDKPSTGCEILGYYREASHMCSRDEFEQIASPQRGRAMSNARLTETIITTENGIRTIHTQNPNCKDRLEFDYNTGAKLQENQSHV